MLVCTCLRGLCKVRCLVWCVCVCVCVCVCTCAYVCVNYSLGSPMNLTLPIIKVKYLRQGVVVIS